MGYLTFQEIMDQGIAFDELEFQLFDDRAYHASGELYSGMVYEFSKNEKQIAYYAYFKDGWEVEAVHFDEEGKVEKHWIQLAEGAGKFEEWHANGIQKELTYSWCNNRVAYKKWDELGKQYDKLKWKEHLCIASLGTMAEKIKAQEMSLEECTAMQDYLRAYIVKENIIDIEDIQLVGGIDLAYWQEGDEEKGVCSIVIIDVETKQVIETVEAIGTIKFPYRPGNLAFRELPLIVEAVEKLQNIPDVYMLDGNGILHPNRMGLATHASYFLKRPTLGVSKNYYKVNNVECKMPNKEKGSYEDIIIDGEVLGRVLRTVDDVKPVFVSIGNCMGLEESTTLVMKLLGKEGHIPLPTQLADIETHKLRKHYRCGVANSGINK